MIDLTNVFAALMLVAVVCTLAFLALEFALHLRWKRHQKRKADAREARERLRRHIAGGRYGR